MKVRGSSEHKGARRSEVGTSVVDAFKGWPLRAYWPPPCLRGMVDRVLYPQPRSNVRLSSWEGTTCTTNPSGNKLHGTSHTLNFSRPCPCRPSDWINLGDMDGNDTIASSRSPQGEHDGRSDVTLGSTWAITSSQSLQPPTALERR